MFDQKFISFSQSPGSINLIGAPIVVDQDDFPGVHIAARNLAKDFSLVVKGTSNPLCVVYTELAISEYDTDIAIIIGSVEKNQWIRRLQRENKLDCSSIHGKWESYITTVVDRPFDGWRKALVIAGSDKRGTIFGVYSMSEQIGVSPWYWWADVVPKSQLEIYALPIPTTQGEPSIRFRGIFINDEAPALTAWVLEKYGKYGLEFYKKVFELLLRLKANFLWPAMWPGYPQPGASFFVDDHETQKTADEYGICISTSHHEPMQRLSNEWFAENPPGSWDWLTNKENITKFFEEGVRRAKGCESFFTLGMRGEYDKKMPTDDPAAVVKDVIQTQRAIIKDVHGQEDAVLQLLALYKEVQDQYETGRLAVPDDVTLLFSDDNFGSIRRLPYGEEIGRKGGAGLYYHFEYVGHPRSYKWTNSNSLGKTWHQLQQAYDRGAREVWVFNIGDIKPMEVPLTFAMTLAWNINSIKAGSFLQFFSAMAHREFGQELGQKISNIWYKYDRLVSLRRHEHVEPDTFSLLYYNEAEIILERWKSLLADAELIHSHAPKDQQPSIFELVLHPVKSSYVFITLQITLGRNKLYALQRRNSTNKLAQEVLDLFDADFTLSEEFHGLLGGNWNGIMQQPHYGFGDTWHAPSRDMISGLCFVQKRQNSNAIVGQMGIMVEGHMGVRPGRTNEESDRTHPSRGDLVPGLTLGVMTRYGPENRWFDIYTRGSQKIHWSTDISHDWVKLSSMSGELTPGEDDERVRIKIEWDQVDDDFDQEILIDICSEEGDFEQVHLPINGRRLPESFKSGFVEGDGYISIPAALCAIDFPYIRLPEVGSSSSGSVSVDATSGEVSTYLTYPIFIFTKRSTVNLLLYFNMTLDIDPTDTMSYDVMMDGSVGQTYQLHELSERGEGGALPGGWESAVQNCMWVKKHQLPEGSFQPGEHLVQLRLNHSNLLLEKLVIDLGHVKDSYLGPPTSFHL